jgi:hypothetical protein
MDDMIEAAAVAVAEQTQAGEARRVAITLASRLGFDETSAGRLAIVVTEARPPTSSSTAAGEKSCSGPCRRTGNGESSFSPSTKDPGSRTSQKV